jgi:hypothetical protein
MDGAILINLNIIRAIVAYLKDTQTFFLRQRVLWAIIMVAISMTRTSGQSVFNFVLRIFGTAAAMVGTYVIWYIVDGKTPGKFSWARLQVGSLLIVARCHCLSMVLDVLRLLRRIKVPQIRCSRDFVSGYRDTYRWVRATGESDWSSW